MSQIVLHVGDEALYRGPKLGQELRHSLNSETIVQVLQIAGDRVFVSRGVKNSGYPVFTVSSEQLERR